MNQTMLKKMQSVWRTGGAMGAGRALLRLLRPTRALCAPLVHDLLTGRRGLEIGGPSGVFRPRGLLPVYDLVSALDNCNFAEATAWEGQISKGMSYRFSPRRPLGHQYVLETTNLAEILPGSYEFLLSSHVLEHTANPIRALREWMRVVRDDGVLVILVPHKDGTFDRRRPVTSLDHLIADFENDMAEDDMTHLEEIMRLHDLEMDRAAGTPEEFRRRSERNLQNRCLHHHVFDTELVAALLKWAGLQLLAIEPARPNHVIAVARKISGVAVGAGDAAIVPGAWRRASPFGSDRTESCRPRPGQA